MKKLIGGGIFFLSGTTLYTVLIDRASSTASELGGFSTPPGRFGTAVDLLGVSAPLNLSKLLMIVGALFIVWGIFADDIKKRMNNKTKKNDKSTT